MASVTNNRKALVAVCQMTSTEDQSKNLQTCLQLVAQAAERKAKVNENLSVHSKKQKLD